MIENNSRFKLQQIEKFKKLPKNVIEHNLLQSAF
jgi:hypothetical protein